MSTGISISSINRIKELAEEKKYAEALEILDTQNLDKSINPQFLRISGEIFRENKRYYDSRRILLKSHEMSPQGTRIIAELIELYLELGYFTRAKRYYEQYMFYSTEDDTMRDYVEYIYKKATGTDVKELASILIPILETMPEDKWNFEAVLLYHKIDRKDKALEEAQYILENFKESEYIKPVIEYIDDRLDVDKCFYVYPKEEVEEDKELYGDLIEKEEKILEADHLRMFPPEAKIIVDVEDKDAIDSRPAKEKKLKKKKDKKKTNEEELKDSDSKNNTKTDSSKEEKSDVDNNKVNKGDKDEAGKLEQTSAEKAEKDKKDDTSVDSSDEDKGSSSEKDASAENKIDEEEAERKRLEEEEEAKKKEREAALEKILARKIDKESLKESAKQIVKNVGQDTKKAREQVKKVTDSVKDNVVKATDSIGEAVGTTKVSKPEKVSDEEFVDGIIESVIETPKKSVGEVVTNEELDALVPDSLEAMSTDEVAEIEARKEEQERKELEELEAAVLAEEEKKNKKNKKKKNSKDEADELSEGTDKESEDVIVVDTSIQNETIATVSFAELKERFLAANAEKEEEDETPLESLGFMTVVQSDVDEKMENDAPEAAEILHRMIDNKEYYTGEDSRGFESKASYLNHGFEVDDYEFKDYMEMDKEPEQVITDDKVFRVEEIFTENTVVDFDEIMPEREETVVEAEEPEPMVTGEHFEPEVEKEEPVFEKTEAEPVMEVEEPEPVMEVEESESVREIEEAEPVMEIEETEPVIEVEETESIVEEAKEEPIVTEPVIETEEQVMEEEPGPVIETEEQVMEEEAESVIKAEETESSIEVEEAEAVMEVEEPEPIVDEAKEIPEFMDYRESLRIRIILTDSMVRGLLDLKESR